MARLREIRISHAITACTPMIEAFQTLDVRPTAILLTTACTWTEPPYTVFNFRQMRTTAAPRYIIRLDLSGHFMHKGTLAERS